MALIADQILFWNLIYHTVHQLRIVNLIYTRHAKIDLFNLSPLYAFSRLTACTALTTVFIAYLWLATYPWLSNDFVVIWKLAHRHPDRDSRFYPTPPGYPLQVGRGKGALER